MSETKPCTRCKGSGKRDVTRYDGMRADGTCIMTVTGREDCYSCDGCGTFEPVDVASILAAIVGTRGAGKGKLLRSRPSKGGDRAYFVWRLARFHGGADVCMPIMAECAIGGDPFEPELNKLSEAVARRAFGTDMAAASRWAPLVSNGSFIVPDGLPSSAYPCGPAGTDIGDVAESPEYHASIGTRLVSEDSDAGSVR